MQSECREPRRPDSVTFGHRVRDLDGPRRALGVGPDHDAAVDTVSGGAGESCELVGAVDVTVAINPPWPASLHLPLHVELAAGEERVALGDRSHRE